MILIGAPRRRVSTLAAAVLLVGLQGCGASEDPDESPDDLGVCSDLLTTETLEKLVPSEERVGMPSGKVEDLEKPWLRVSCGLGNSTTQDSVVTVAVVSEPAKDARESVAKVKRDSLAAGNQCRALGGTDGVGEGVICFGGTGATGNDPGVQVSTWLGTRYYDLRLKRSPEDSWDLVRGEAMALVKEIDENLTRELGG